MNEHSEVELQLMAEDDEGWDYDLDDIDDDPVWTAAHEAYHTLIKGRLSPEDRRKALRQACKHPSIISLMMIDGEHLIFPNDEEEACIMYYGAAGTRDAMLCYNLLQFMPSEHKMSPRSKKGVRHDLLRVVSADSSWRIMALRHLELSKPEKQDLKEYNFTYPPELM